MTNLNSQLGLKTENTQAINETDSHVEMEVERVDAAHSANDKLVVASKSDFDKLTTEEKVDASFKAAAKDAFEQTKFEKSSRDATRRSLGHLVVLIHAAMSDEDGKQRFRELLGSEVTYLKGSNSITKVMTETSNGALHRDCLMAIRLGWHHLGKEEFKNLTRFAKVLFMLCHSDGAQFQIGCDAFDADDVVREIKAAGGTEVLIADYSNQSALPDTAKEKLEQAQREFGEVAMFADYKRLNSSNSLNPNLSERPINDGVGLCVVRHQDGEIRIVGVVEGGNAEAENYLLKSGKNPPTVVTRTTWLQDAIFASNMLSVPDSEDCLVRIDVGDTSVFEIGMKAKRDAPVVRIDRPFVDSFPTGAYYTTGARLNALAKMARVAPEAELKVTKDGIILSLSKGTFDTAIDRYDDTLPGDNVFVLPESVKLDDTKAIVGFIEAPDERVIPVADPNGDWKPDAIWFDDELSAEFAANAKKLAETACSVRIMGDRFTVMETVGSGRNARQVERFTLMLEQEPLPKETDMALSMFSEDVIGIANLLAGGTEGKVFYSVSGLKVSTKKHGAEWVAIFPARSGDMTYVNNVFTLFRDQLK